jgi:hypothetical protein
MRPLDFSVAVLEAEGAVVEGGAGGADALLPEALASALGWEAEVRLVEQPGRAGEGARSVGYGTQDLEQVLAFARGYGDVCSVGIALPAPIWRDLAREARTSYRFETKVRIRFAETTQSVHTYSLFHFGLSALSEESHEEIIAVAVDEATLVPVGGLAGALDAHEDRFTPARAGDAARPPADYSGILTAGCREAEREARKRLGAFVATMERRRGRDAERLHTYFASLAQELSGGSRRERSTAAIAERLATIRREYERKVFDLGHRYRLRARLTPVAVARVSMQVLRGTYQFQWRTAERRLAVVWNPVLEALEPIGCDACGAGEWTLTVGTDLVIHCSACDSPAAGAPS